MKEFVGGEVRVMRRIVGEGRERVIPGKVFREEGDDIKVRNCASYTPVLNKSFWRIVLV